MSSCAAQTFTSISPTQFACLVAQANNAGIPISGNSGSASQDGFTVAWTFDPGTGTLQIQCTSAPFLVPCGMINSKIHDLVDQCTQTTS